MDGSYYFQDRVDAGKQLALLLQSYQEKPNTIIFGIPRGGVPIADEIAIALHLPLDVLLYASLVSPGKKK